MLLSPELGGWGEVHSGSVFSHVFWVSPGTDEQGELLAPLQLKDSGELSICLDKLA